MSFDIDFNAFRFGLEVTPIALLVIIRFLFGRGGGKRGRQ
jgi:hypothetical protein